MTGDMIGEEAGQRAKWCDFHSDWGGEKITSVIAQFLQPVGLHYSIV